MMIPEKHILSKSTFMYGNQCMKRLWLHKFNPALRDEEDEAQIAIFQTGTDVGLLAQQRYFGGIDASPLNAFHYQQSVYNTANLIAKGVKVIYEAAFQFDGVLAAMDILVKRKDKWYAYEVKSSTSVKEPFLQDAALQYYVITKSGLPLENIFIMHLNNSYVRNGNLDLQQLFTPVSVLEEVQNKQAETAAKILDLKIMLKLKLMPDIKMGNHCNKPYSCDFLGYCSKQTEVKLPVYDKPVINKEEIRQFINTLEYPLYFLNIETWSTAVPEQDGQWPYRKMPFQFSVLIQNEPDGKLKHIEYLAKNKDTDLCFFIKKLLAALDSRGSILVYNKLFFNTRLKELKKQFIEYEEAINAIQERLANLMTPFSKNNDYLPWTDGSYTLIHLLPALFSGMTIDFPETSNRIDSSSVFYNLDKESEATIIAEKRKELQEFCKLNTQGMVKIIEVLKKG